MYVHTSAVYMQVHRAMMVIALLYLLIHVHVHVLYIYIYVYCMCIIMHEFGQSAANTVLYTYNVLASICYNLKEFCILLGLV